MLTGAGTKTQRAAGRTPGENTALFVHFDVKKIILPRQARDKHRERTQKESRFLQHLLHLQRHTGAKQTIHVNQISDDLPRQALNRCTARKTKFTSGWRFVHGLRVVPLLVAPPAAQGPLVTSRMAGSQTSGAARTPHAVGRREKRLLSLTLPFENDGFAKTGSGQTAGDLNKGAFCLSFSV